jgi:hypothetical protein
MDISKITEIVLDKNDIFNHKIKIYQGTFLAEIIPVNQNESDKILLEITSVWLKEINKGE